MAFGEGGVFAFEGEIDHAAERGVSGVLPVAEFFGVEGGVVVMGRGLYGVVPWPVGLDVDLAGTVAASCASGDLSKELEGLFGGAEVRHVETGIGVDDPDKGDAGIVVTLGEHLRSDEDVDFPGGEASEDFCVTAFPGGGIGIHAFDARFWEGSHEVVLDFLRACAEVDEWFETAFAADFGAGFLRAAVVASEDAAAAVVGEADLAILAGGDPSAGRA